MQEISCDDAISRDFSDESSYPAPAAYAPKALCWRTHGGLIATPSDLVRFAMHVDGFSYTPSLLEESTIETMTAPCLISPLPHSAK
jgi:hypothetical protein